MRRLVGIPAKGAVVVALPLMGAIYVAAEATQAAIRLHNKGAVQSATSTVRQISSTMRDDAVTKTIAFSMAELKPAADLKVPDPKAEKVDSAPGEQAGLPAPTTAKLAAKDKHNRQIVISIPDRELAFVEDGEVVRVFPVAVGTGKTPSPHGDFTIINHAVDPTYRHKGKEIAPGPNNPLGDRWMGLSLKGYGIHGTNVQSSVGKAASHGCFRMKKHDVEELYSLVKVGDAVTIRGERNDLTATLFSAGAPASPVPTASKTETAVSSN